jgi:hypothetical protein
MKTTRNQIRKLISEAMFFEHRIKPSLPAHIPASHAEKINAMIDRGTPEDINQARSFLDSYGAPNYVDNYIAYQEVGDMEKLGGRAEDILSNLPQDPEESKDALGRIYGFGGIESQAQELAMDKAVRDAGDDLGRIIDLDDIHMDRYFNANPSNRTRAGIEEKLTRNQIRKIIIQEIRAIGRY